MLGLFAKGRFERRVAVDAASEESLPRVEPIGADYLNQLLTKVAARDEEPMRTVPSCREWHVAGQQYAFLAPGKRHELVVVE